MNHLISCEFKHITMHYLPTSDIMSLLLVSKSVNNVVNESSRWNSVKPYTQEPIKFLFYMEKIQLPMTLEAHRVFMSIDDKKAALKAINDPIRNLTHSFIDVCRCVGNLWMLVDFKLGMNPYMNNQSQQSLLFVRGSFIPIDYPYEQEHEEEDVVILCKRKIAKLHKLN